MQRNTIGTAEVASRSRSDAQKENLEPSRAVVDEDRRSTQPRTSARVATGCIHRAILAGSPPDTPTHDLRASRKASGSDTVTRPTHGGRKG